ncbi:MAG: hypothetical protein WCJ60_03925 [bacterium]
MRNINDQQTSLVSNEMLNVVSQNFELAPDPDEVLTYHDVNHTQRVCAVSNIMIRNLDTNFELTRTDKNIIYIAASGHDTVMVEHPSVFINADHPEFIKKRVRNMSGCAEQASADLLEQECLKVDICHDNIDLIKFATYSTVVDFVNGRLVQPNLLNGGNKLINFIVAKSDIFNLPLQSVSDKEDTIISLWLEQYPDAVKALINNKLVINEDHYNWIADNLGYFLSPLQVQFAESQRNSLFSDAENCQLSVGAMHALSRLFSGRIHKNHIADIDRIANKVLQTPESITKALHKAVRSIIQSRSCLLKSV